MLLRKIKCSVNTLRVRGGRKRDFRWGGPLRCGDIYDMVEEKRAM